MLVVAEFFVFTVMGVAKPNEISPSYLFRFPGNGDCRGVERGLQSLGRMERTGSLVLGTTDLGIGQFSVAILGAIC